MNKFLISLLSALALFVAGFLVFDAFVDAPKKSVSVDAHNIRDNDVAFRLCNADPLGDATVILVSEDVASCGQSVSFEHDGGTISGVVDGVLVVSAMGIVQVQRIDDGKARVDALSQNQVVDVTVY